MQGWVSIEGGNPNAKTDGVSTGGDVVGTWGSKVASANCGGRDDVMVGLGNV